MSECCSDMDLPKRLFRCGRAHLVCIDCGRDHTLMLMWAHQCSPEIVDRIPVMTPKDYQPIKESA